MSIVERWHRLAGSPRCACWRICCQLATLGLVAACGGGGGGSGSGTDSGLANAQLTWDAPASLNFTDYRVHFGTASGIYSESMTVEKSVTSTVVNGLS